MKREIVYSVLLHTVVLVLTVFSSPFDTGSKPDYTEVIRVSLLASEEVYPVSEEAEPVIIQTPAAMPKELPEIPIGEPTTSDEAPVDEEPEPEPEPKPEGPPETTPTVTRSEAAGDGGGEEEIHSPVTGGRSPFAGATIDNASFSYPYWFTQAFNKILRNWRNPVAADGAVVCVVYFQVIKSGRVVDVEVKNSSGLETFDDACVRAVQRSTPFPPLPREFRDEIIGITLPFKYEPR